LHLIEKNYLSDHIHVTNNTNSTINIEQHNLGVIKEPSETLFAFTGAEIELNFQAIQPDARFLFTNLAKLTLIVAENRVSTVMDKTILRKVKIFEKISSLQKNFSLSS
jgi:hypothetical protein